MPYYRIVVRLADPRKIVQGIRWLELRNIDAVQNHMTQKARHSYREYRLEDVEVQMLSKNSQAVQQYLQALEKQKDHKRFPSAKVINLPKQRKDRG
jgi:hypothetical protein